MAYKRAFGENFIEGTIMIVARLGIENMRTKDVADYAGFSEATMFRKFPTKEILLRETFLYIDKQISNLLTQSDFVKNPEAVPFEQGVYNVWHKVYRYLIDHKEETIFLIRYRYSSLYSDEVRSLREAYNGNFAPAYAIFEKNVGKAVHAYQGFLINYIFEMTLCFVEKIIGGKVRDTADTEYCIWLAASNAVKAWARYRDGGETDSLIREKTDEENQNRENISDQAAIRSRA